MDTERPFKRGDYVKFIAHAADDVPHGVAEEMEENFYGKIFEVTSCINVNGYQGLELAPTPLSPDVTQDMLDKWSYSSPMFELYTAPTEATNAKEFISFDDFLKE